MASYVRHNAWNNGGSFNNPDLLWYAKGVGKMMNRSLNDPASWWFFAAIHGEYVNPKNPWYPSPPAFPGWGFVQPQPQVPTTPLPDAKTQDLFWNQCQHGSWYFLPWHRGYLLALEAQLRADIISLGGPATWALSYWNYFGGDNGNQYPIPPAFAAQALPDGSANPIYVAMRYGPDANSDIYIPTPAGEATHPSDPNYPYGEVADVCLKNDLFTGSDASTPLPGFGGPQSGFSHSGRTHGNMESNPHDLVHVYVGGSISDADYGLMADPGTAALDPIFYLHHANVDRMWAGWNASGNANPSDAHWMSGPTRRFVMPWPQAEPWYYTPAQMDSLSKLDYTYQELTTQPASAAAAVASRLKLLGATPTLAAAAGQAKSAPPAQGQTALTELLGANAGSLPIRGRATQTSVQLDSGGRHKVMASLANVSEPALPDNVYLKLENVRGSFDASVVSVYVNMPSNTPPRESRKYLAGNVGMFGLRRASVKDGDHAGEGLTFLLDVTHIVDQLHLAKTLDVGSLNVSLQPTRALPDKADITVGRISLYRQTH